MITPARQLIRDEVKELMSSSFPQLDRWSEGARLSDNREICKHPFAPSEALLP
jgi:hypothetical protein